MHKKALNNLVQFQLLFLFHTFHKWEEEIKEKLLNGSEKEPQIIFDVPTVCNDAIKNVFKVYEFYLKIYKRDFK